MTKISLKMLAVASLAFMAGCNSNSYKKTPSGLMYKIIGSGNAPEVKVGDVLKLNYIQKINDSVLFTSYDKMPAYAKVDSAQGEYNPTEIFRYLHKGDSAVIVQFVDSLMKKNPGMLPPYMKKGDKLMIYFKVLDVFNVEDSARADGEREMAKEGVRVEKQNKEKMASSATEVETFLASKNIKAEKTGEGTFVAIKTQGTGPQADSGKYVSVRYTGKLLKGEKQFESNMEEGKEPFSFVLGTGQVIKGWDEGLKLLKKGAKATLYIPGTLAYGPRPGPGGETFESLIFEVELVDVADNAPAAPMPGAPPAGQ